MGDSCSDSESIDARYDWSQTAASMAVINAIAAIENTDPENRREELAITLHDHVNPEALDTVVTNDTSVSISFPIRDYEIRIDGNTLTIACK
ncbi:HalOD1 output domain-containing protein [Natrinema ejinorense]|uniref:Halobacterial output domain-containing protein n=1 Tax=Natrinema ejinorense TaxID=373386 RepID=A0A2A5QTT8_9EURY|nr:HalOD1 output domain-containing protein [Natrinema ejinorense]PCR90232.1 hypothetical protein CP557_06560 [Natrinema ejinorense]